MLPAKFQVIWPFGSGVEAKNKFKDARQSGHLGLQIRTILAILIYRSPRCFLPSLKLICLSFQEKKRKKVFKMAAMAAVLEQF